MHFAGSNSLNTKDKYTKVRLLHDKTNKNLKQLGIFHSYYSVHKQMIPSTSKNSSRQTIRTKTIRFGCKNFAMMMFILNLSIHNVGQNRCCKVIQKSYC